MTVRVSHIILPVGIFILLAVGGTFIAGTVYKKNICIREAEARTNAFYPKESEVTAEKRDTAYQKFYSVCDELNVIYHVLSGYEGIRR